MLGSIFYRLPHLRQFQGSTQIGPGPARIDKRPHAQTGIHICGRSFPCSSRYSARKAARFNRGEQRGSRQQFHEGPPAVVVKQALGQVGLLSLVLLPTLESKRWGAETCANYT